MDAVLVEKPPVAMVEKVWQMASKKFMPARLKARISATVSPM